MQTIKHVDTEQLRFADMRRGAIRVVAKDASADDLLTYTERQREKHDWDVCVVFAYKDDKSIQDYLAYNVARVQSCKHVGAGWTGDGRWLGGAAVKEGTTVILEWAE